MQQWFASIITRPMDSDSQMNPISPSGVPMTQEACDYIIPSLTLRPEERIQIYNQQYWWRLLSIMQDVYPCVLRFFHYFDFNETIATPYLVKYPPNHWSLNHLGDYLPKWIWEEYHAEDKILVYNSALIDWAYSHSFLVPAGAPLDLSILPDPNDIASILEQNLTLQPHVHLFQFPYNLFEFRGEFLKQNPDYWVDNDFPPLVHLPDGEQIYFVLYRTCHNNIAVNEVTKSEFVLLQRFCEGSTIDNLCQWLETQDESLCADAASNLQSWFQKWTSQQLLTTDLVKTLPQINTDKTTRG